MHDEVPLSIVISLRNKTQEEAKRMLEPYKLDDETKARYLAIASLTEHKAPELPKSVARFEPDRRLWMATAHLLGASFRQLGRFHSISPQTVIFYIDRILPVEGRSEQRLQTKLSHEAVSRYHEEFVKHRALLRQLTPREAAEWLHANVNLMDD